MTTIPNFLTTREAADELGVTDARVRQLIIGEQLRAVRLGGKALLIARKDLESLKKNRESVQ